MARYFLNIGTDWGNTANWSDTDGGAGGFSVPTTADDVFFTALSGNCTVNASARVCKTLNFTGYANTITMSQNITVSGDVTLSASMIIAGTGELWVNATATLTSNGKAWPNLLWIRPTSTSTVTLGDNWNVGHLDLSISAVSLTLNSNIITTLGDCVVQSTSNGCSGTTQVIMAGTGTLSTFLGSFLRLPLEINTAGTITLGTWLLKGNDFIITAGTVVTTGNTLQLQNVSMNFQTNGTAFNNVTFGNATGIVVTLLDDLTVNGTLQLGTSNSNNYVINGFSIYANSNFSVQGINTRIIGTTNFIVAGNCTWTSGVASYLELPLNVNTSGTLTLTGTLYYRNNTFTHTAGAVAGTGTIFVNGNTTWNTSGMSFPNLNFDTGTQTLSSDLTVGGTFTTRVSVVINGNTLFLNGNFTLTGGNDVTGTTNIVYSGTGTWSASNATGVLRNNFTINTAGTLTVSNVYYRNGTLTYTAGTVNTGTLNIVNNCTIDSSGMVWSSVNIINSATITFNSVFYCGTLNLPNAAVTLNGTAGFNTDNLTNTALTASRTCTIKNGLTYDVNNSLVLSGTPTFIYSIISSTVSSYSFFNLNVAASQNLSYVNATDIDSSGGQTIRTTAGMILTRTINWAYKASSNFFFFFQ